MSFKAKDLAFQIILEDQKLGFKVHNTPGGGGVVLADKGAVTCGPTNQKGPYVINCNIGFRDKSNFNKLRDALSEFMKQMNAIDVT